MITPADRFVVDTHSLIWHLENSPRLSSSARQAFDFIEHGFSPGIVPTIVLAELMHVSEKGRTTLDFRAFMTRMQRIQGLVVAPFDLDMLLHMYGLDVFDIHDRIIVAAALLFDAKIITNDRVIQSSGIVDCVW